MKNIVISGANQGIGYYMVRELLREGYTNRSISRGSQNYFSFLEKGVEV